MKLEVVHVSRGDIRLKSDDKIVRVLGEALLASMPTEPSYIVYLNSLKNWEEPPQVALTKTEKEEVVIAIRKYFQARSSLVEFE